MAPRSKRKSRLTCCVAKGFSNTRIWIVQAPGNRDREKIQDELHGLIKA